MGDAGNRLIVAGEMIMSQLAPLSAADVDAIRVCTPRSQTAVVIG